jgi:HTH-type transcriptional regulator/antitoxin HipB
LLFRERRKELKLDQHELARRAGVSRQWIIDLEQGKAGVALGLVLRTAQALGLVLELTAARVEAKRPGSGPSSGSELDALIKRLEDFPALKGKRG